MKFKNQTFLVNNNGNFPVGEIEWTNNNKNEINFKISVIGILDGKKNTIDEFKNELEQLLEKYLK